MLYVKKILIIIIIIKREVGKKKNTTQCPRPGFEQELLDPKESVLIMRLSCHHYRVLSKVFGDCFKNTV